MTQDPVSGYRAMHVLIHWSVGFCTSANHMCACLQERMCMCVLLRVLGEGHREVRPSSPVPRLPLSTHRQGWGQPGPDPAISQVGCHVYAAAVSEGEAAGWRADLFPKPQQSGAFQTLPAPLILLGSV